MTRTTAFETKPSHWLIVGTLLALLPVVAAPITGMADLPNHLARLHVLAMRGPLDAYLAVDWRWIGNLGVDLPVLALARWTGVEDAMRIVVAVIAPLTVVGIILLARAGHGRMSGGAALALPFALSQPWLYGFANYTLGVALALIAAALWLRRPAGGPASAALWAIVALGLWTAHVMGWAIFVLIVAGVELAGMASARGLVRRAAATLPILAPLVPMLVWRGTASGPAFTLAPHFLASKLVNVATMLKGTTRAVDLAMLGLVALAAVVALIAARRGRIEPRLGAAAALLALAALVLPTTVLGSWGADLRLTPVAAILALLAIRPARDRRIEIALLAAGLALFAARAGWVAVQWARESAVIGRRLAILDAVPRGSMMGFVAADRTCGTPWRLDPDRKLGSYALVRRDAFTNTLFQIPGADLMTIRDPAIAARWYDGSQDVAARCPGGGIDRAAVQARVRALADAGFTTVWIAGVPWRTLAMPGFAAVAARDDDTLVRPLKPISTPRP